MFEFFTAPDPQLVQLKADLLDFLDQHLDPQIAIMLQKIDQS
jgi:hypothetical protein